MVPGVDEQTLQFVIRIFAVTVMLIMLSVLITLSIIVIHDGNNANVQNAFNTLASLAQWGIGIMGAVIVGKPVSTAISSYLATKGTANIVSAAPKEGASVTVNGGTTTVAPLTVPVAESPRGAI